MNNTILKEFKKIHKIVDKRKFIKEVISLPNIDNETIETLLSYKNININIKEYNNNILDELVNYRPEIVKKLYKQDKIPESYIINGLICANSTITFNNYINIMKNIYDNSYSYSLFNNIIYNVFDKINNNEHLKILFDFINNILKLNYINNNYIYKNQLIDNLLNTNSFLYKYIKYNIENNIHSDIIKLLDKYIPYYKLIFNKPVEFKNIYYLKDIYYILDNFYVDENIIEPIFNKHNKNIEQNFYIYAFQYYNFKNGKIYNIIRDVASNLDYNNNRYRNAYIKSLRNTIVNYDKSLSSKYKLMNLLLLNDLINGFPIKVNKKDFSLDGYLILKDIIQFIKDYLDNTIENISDQERYELIKFIKQNPKNVQKIFNQLEIYKKHTQELLDKKFCEIKEVIKLLDKDQLKELNNLTATLLEKDKNSIDILNL